MDSPVTQFLNHPLWQEIHRARLIPLGESAEVVRFPAGERLFRQFHPANQFSLLVDGVVEHETGNADEESWPLGRVSWQWGALGWSGFLPPSRHGTSARAISDVELITWDHDALATVFYSDPLLAAQFFRFVLDSVRRQFEWVRSERCAIAADRAYIKTLPDAKLVRVARHADLSVLTTLRRSSFFEQFEDSTLERLAGTADALRGDHNAPLVSQDAATDGLLLLADGEAMSYFSAKTDHGEAHDSFRTIPEHGGMLAGVPTLDGGYVAEATMLAASPCRLFRIPTDAIDRLINEDPEFGRGFMQRQLARLSYLIATARLPKPHEHDDPEIGAIKSVLEQNQARIPVTSSLHRIPHLLGNKLTTHEVFSALRVARETGEYQERAIAHWCTDILQGVRGEMRFYDDVLTAYTDVTSAPEDTPAPKLRRICDQSMSYAFSHLEHEIHGLANLPQQGGNIVIMNHLGCPAYYELPNHYHFSFDTAFVSALMFECYGESPIRVVRQSPGVEHGHDLFYGRLGHIKVPTLESGLEELSPEQFEELRRRASEALFENGQTALQRGENILLCPEGQSQRADMSPARFHSGAFRLALQAETEPYIVPIAVAGFDRRYKESKLIAMIQRPFRLSEKLKDGSADDLRPFLDDYRQKFARVVRTAYALSRNLEPDGMLDVVIDSAPMPLGESAVAMTTDLSA